MNPCPNIRANCGGIAEAVNVATQMALPREANVCYSI
jgi:hypothetical protein